MNPFEPPGDRPDEKKPVSLRTRLVAFGLVGTGCWYLYAGVYADRHGWLQVALAGLCFGFARIVWN
ncbi:MAG TPA: hypothetical protein VMS65_06975 [Polyangiaceae bacterium]|nr:hypothetical protein [Polyangiaceae bacterium]